jgi:hypothetical protein
VSARVTFGHVNEPGPFVTPVQANGDDDAQVEIDPRLFEIPEGYRMFDENQPSSECDCP